MIIPNILAILVLVIGVPLNLIVTVMLWRRARQAPLIKVLRERLVAAAAVLLVVFVFGLVFINNDTIPPPIETDATKILTRSAMLVIAIIPALYWLWLYRSMKQDEEDEEVRHDTRDEGRDIGRDSVRDPARDAARDIEHDATQET